MTADTALRLARYFDMEAEFWMNLQSRYDLEATSDQLAGRLEHEVQPRAWHDAAGDHVRARK